MKDDGLTAEKILGAAVEALRRFGPDKARVVDVARALGVSHAAVYRHYPSKDALWDAVARHWLHSVAAPLAVIAAAPLPPAERLRQWVRELSAIKRGRARDDAELFATYAALAETFEGAVLAHVAELERQMAAIIAGGMADGTFRPVDAAAAGRAVVQATARFHHPAHVAAWSSPSLEAEMEAVLDLLLAGLKA